MTTPTKPILVAGLLGGLLGGVASFAATRLLKPAEPAKTEVAVSAEAKQIAESFIGKLRAAKYDEFLLDVKTGREFFKDTEFDAFKKKFEHERDLLRGVYGVPTGEIELVSETALRPDLVRFVYLEKFPRGGVAWFLVLYRDAERWRLNEVVWNHNLSLAFLGK